MAAACVSRGSAALHRLLHVLRPCGALHQRRFARPPFKGVGGILTARSSVAFFARAKVRKKMDFREEKHFFAERLAGWEKGCIFAASIYGLAIR